MNPDVTLRPMVQSDIPAGLRLCRVCRWNQLVDDWQFFLHEGGAHLACQGESVLGTVAFLRYDAFAWIAMMLVDPQTRRAGIGSLLMTAALESLRQAPGVRLDATPAGEPLYRRFGFTEEYSLVRTAATIAADRFAPGDDVRPMQSEELAEVFTRDRHIFGADRSSLLASFYGRAPELAWVCLSGYCFGRPGYLYSQLGPVVAEDLETAAALVSTCLAHLQGTPVAIDVPTHSPAWLRWMQSAGFQIERPFLRMRLRGPASYGMPERQFAIAGPDFG